MGSLSQIWACLETHGALVVYFSVHPLLATGSLLNDVMGKYVGLAQWRF